VHAGLVVAGFLVTWTVIAVRDEPPAPVIVADFESMTFAPLAQLAEAPALAEQPMELPVRQPPPEPAPPAPADDLPALDLLAPAAAPTVAPPPAVSAPTPVATRLGADFVGLSTSNAKRVAYVIDASGSMIRTLPIVLDELRRSLERLDPVQSFAIVFFQGERAVRVRGARRLAPARPDEIDAHLAWIDENVVPEGRSNPVAALRAAVDAGLVGQDDAEVLVSSWRLAGEMRNAIVHVTGRPSDVVPKDGRVLESLSRVLGYEPGQAAQMQEEHARTTRRARRVVERVFYGET